MPTSSTTPDAPPIQVFGLVDDRATRAAQRFFKERRLAIHFVDLRRKPIAPGELRRFTDRLGAAACSTPRAGPIGPAGSATSGWTIAGSSSGCWPTSGCSGCRSSGAGTT